MTDEAPLVRVLSLGAGVQSSALAYLYEYRMLQNPPDYAIFADTQREPQAVYKMLDKMRGEINRFPIHITSVGDLGENPAKIPFFIKKPDGSVGLGGRQCSSDYKIKAVHKKIRGLLGYQKYERWKHRVEIILGMSTDEMRRVREPQEKWAINRYPLINEISFSRESCLLFLTSRGIKAPRSACYFCPYRSDKEWLYLKKHSPEEFEKACDYDEKIRKEGGYTNYIGEQYVHRSCQPLREVEFKNQYQLDLFETECDTGMYGV